MPSATQEVRPVVELKRLNPGVVNRKDEYPRLANGTKVLVTTGGTIADATISQLSAAGCLVTTLSLLEEGQGVGGVLISSGSCTRAVDGQEVVVHAGQVADRFSSEVDAGRLVIEGTRLLLEAAVAAGSVKAFVFASSASVVFGDEDFQSAISEDAPYPTKFIDPVSAGTAEAERAVLRATATTGGGGGGAGNGDGSSRGTMLTCSVRAAPVYGPGQHQPESSLVGGLASRAKRGIRSLGDGKNVVDFVYAGNVAHALLLAAQGLLEPKTPSQAPGDGVNSSPPPAAAAAGRAFFVTDAEPVPYSEFAGRALSRLGYPAPAEGSGIPLAIAEVLAFLLRVMALVLSPIFEFRPALTTRRIAEEGRACRLDVSTARQELGYSPLWTQEEGLDMTLRNAESLRNPAAKVKHVGPFTAAEVARHSSEDDAWIIVDGKVYDITPYLGQHPGGDAMLRNAGGDSTEGMHGPQHPAQAMEILEQHYIGKLETP